MTGFSRAIATVLAALVLSALHGCTPTRGTTTGPAEPPQSLTHVASPEVAGIWGNDGPPANPPNFVEVHAAAAPTETEGEIPRYSNTYVYETLDGPDAGPFVTAAYFEGGGYPVYYPYPYTVGSRQHDDPWNSAYSSSSRPYRSSSSAGAGFGTAIANAKTGRGSAGNRSKARAGGTRSTMGRVNRASAASAQRWAAAGGRQRSGKAGANTSDRQPSAGYLAARARGGYRSGGSHSRFYYRERKGNVRTRPGAAQRASSRARAKVRGTGRRR